MNIKNIIFDFGGVVMDWDPRYFFRDYFNDDEKMEYFLGNIATNEWNAEQDRGRSVAEANALLISKHPEWEKEILAYYENWHIMLRSDIPENVYAIHKLFRSETDLKALYEEHKGKYKALKDALVEDIKNFIKPMRERREKFASEPELVKKILEQGNKKANEVAQAKLVEIKKAIGVR